MSYQLSYVIGFYQPILGTAPVGQAGPDNGRKPIVKPWPQTLSPKTQNQGALGGLTLKSHGPPPHRAENLTQQFISAYF